MKNKVIWLSLSIFLVAAMLLASCNKSSTTTTTESLPTSTTNLASLPSTTTSASIPTSTTNLASLPTSTTVTTTSTGNWWDKLGAPQYGGTMTNAVSADVPSFDPYIYGASVDTCWDEFLFAGNWTTDPAVFNFKLAFTPPEYASGQLAQSYTFTDPQTVSVTLRQNIFWQNIAPANGRQFVADDVAYKFNRLYGLGGYGFTTPGSSSVTNAVKVFLKLKSVTAPSKYTVVFSFTGANTEDILEGITGPNIPKIECPDQVKQDGDANNWHHVIGTGPFMLTDYVSGSSATLVKNPNYWAYDERHPQNKLPYVDRVTYLIIPNTATAMAALRSGKITALDGLTILNSQQLAKSNPELLDATEVSSSGLTVDMRNDKAPFNDIRVREAMQMAIDLPTLAATYYQGKVDPSPLALTSRYLYPAYGWPYSQWPQDLKDQYAFNTTQAKALLAAAGYPNGFNTTCIFNTTGDSDLLQIVASELKAVNINMSITPMDNGSYITVAFGHNVQAMNFTASGSLSHTYSPMLSIQNYSTNMLFNWQMVSDPAMDAIVNDAVSSSATLDQIKQDLIKANKMVVQGHYVISLLDPPTYAVYQPNFHGYNGQYNSIARGTTAGANATFYLSRFWISQN